MTLYTKCNDCGKWADEEMMDGFANDDDSFDYVCETCSKKRRLG